MNKDYYDLPPKDRRAAKELAKELLRSVAPRSQTGRATGSVRGALLTAVMKPENVEAVLIYDDGQGNWWGDLVLRHASGITQYGIHEESPVKSYGEALDFIKSEVAHIKSKIEEHPIAQQCRQMGIDPAEVHLLSVIHPDVGCRWIVSIGNAEITEGAKTFEVLFSEHKEPLAYIARQLLLGIPREYITDSYFLVPRELGSVGGLMYRAADYVIENGVRNVRSKDILDTPSRDYEWRMGNEPWGIRPSSDLAELWNKKGVTTSVAEIDLIRRFLRNWRWTRRFNFTDSQGQMAVGNDNGERSPLRDERRSVGRLS